MFILSFQCLSELPPQLPQLSPLTPTDPTIFRHLKDSDKRFEVYDMKFFTNSLKNVIIYSKRIDCDEFDFQQVSYTSN